MRVARDGLALRVEALLLGHQYAHAVAGCHMRFGQMGQCVVFGKHERRGYHQHLLALRQGAKRRKAIALLECNAFRARQRRLPIVVHKIARIHGFGQLVPHRIARRTEQHRTREGGKTTFVKQAAN